MTQSTAFDTNSELLVQRYRNGIKLIKPPADYSQPPANSVWHIYNSPIYAYFFNLESQYISLNLACTEELGAGSSSDVLGRNVEHFFTKETKEQLLKNNHQVINSNNLNILEESGTLKDDREIRTISFKYPWYYENQIIGIFGCSVNLHKNSFDLFTKSVSLLAETGLLTPTEASSSTNTLEGNSLTEREMEVLHVLTKGKTMKGIAIELGISSRTVESHLVHIKKKLNLYHREDLVAFYWNLGRPT